MKSVISRGRAFTLPGAGQWMRICREDIRF